MMAPFADFRDSCNRRLCKRNEAGDWLCSECQCVLAETQTVLCADCNARATERRIQEDRKREAEQLREAFDGQLAGSGSDFGHTNPPRWSWARLSNEEFRRRVDPTLLAGVEAWSPRDGSLLLAGPTGRGKSALAMAWLYRMLDAKVEAALAGRKVRLPSFAWISGPELAGCRRRWSIGEESPIVKLALKKSILVLDELGFEPPSEEVFFVLDHRYREGSRTIVTTGATVDEFRSKYGDALLRRLIEPGTIVEAGA